MLELKLYPRTKAAAQSIQRDLSVLSQILIYEQIRRWYVVGAEGVMLLGQCIRSDKTRKRGRGNHGSDSIARATQGAKLHKSAKTQHLLTQKHFLGAHRKDRLCLLVGRAIPQLHDQSQSALICRAKRNRDE